MKHTISLDRVPPQPWKNGGGSTQELLTWPTPESWTLRVSVATIDQDGPFSAYPGIERWFAVIHGAGVALRFDEGPVLVTGADAPLRFDGADAPECALLDGPTRDLNLMVRDGVGGGSMVRVVPDAHWVSAATFRSVFTTGAAMLHCGPGEPVVLAANSFAWCENAAGERWRLAPVDSSLRAWWVDVWFSRAEG